MAGIIDILANQPTTFSAEFMLSINSGRHIYCNVKREQSPYWGFWLLPCDMSFCSLPSALVLS